MIKVPTAKPTGKGMQLTERDVEIVRSISDCGALTGDQIRRHHQFGSVGRTNATLLRLVKHRYLIRRYQPTLVGTRRPVYLLGPGGAVLLHGMSRRSAYSASSDLFLDHRLAVNDFRFTFEDFRGGGYEFHRWLSEESLRELKLGVVPDGYVEYAFGGSLYCAFVEVDRGTEALRRWDAKVAAYLTLAFSGTYGRILGRRFFRVLVTGHTIARVHALQARIAVHTDRVFWLTTDRELIQTSPFAPIWRRPRSDALQSLNQH